MKKTKLLMPLLGLTALSSAMMPLVSCGCGNKNKGDLAFTASNGVMTDGMNGTITIDWTPTSDSVTISNVTLKYDGGTKTAYGTIDDPTARPCVVKLNYPEEIIDNNITDGQLNFHYNDATTSKEEDVTKDNITITKYDIQTVEMNFNHKLQDGAYYFLSPCETATQPVTIKPYTNYKFIVSLDDFGEDAPDFSINPWTVGSVSELVRIKANSTSVSRNGQPLTKVDDSISGFDLNSDQYNIPTQTFVVGGKWTKKEGDIIIIQYRFDIMSQKDVILGFTKWAA